MELDRLHRRTWSGRRMPLAKSLSARDDEAMGSGWSDHNSNSREMDTLLLLTSAASIAPLRITYWMEEDVFILFS
jgi:hypothetical protein